MRNRQEAEARQSILNQILHPEAADRLGRIRLVKEERANDVENRLIMLARTGQLRQKVTEAQLKELLNAVADNKEEEAAEPVAKKVCFGFTGFVTVQMAQICVGQSRQRETRFKAGL